MACSCKNLLDDLSAKFDLILELVQAVLELAQNRGRLSYAVTYTQRMRRIAENDRELFDLIQIVVTGNIL